MQLKYKQLIETQNLSIKCPPDGCGVNEKLEAARWVVEPIDDKQNFVPNHVYNLLRSIPPRTNMNEELKCGYCSVSLHSTIEASKTAFNNLSKVIQSKIGYTHIAHGVIDRGWGLVTELNPISQHFEIFENEGHDWAKKFKVVAPINLL